MTDLWPSGLRNRLQSQLMHTFRQTLIPSGTQVKANSHVRRSGRRAGPRRVTLALHDSAARNNFHPPDSRLPGATAGGGGSGTLGSRPRGLNLQYRVWPHERYTRPQRPCGTCGRG